MKQLGWAQYSLLATPLAMLGLPVYIYLPSYYTQNFSLSLSAIGSALLLARLIDVITDPLVGYWSDRIRGSFSRKKQIVFGSILLIIFLNPLLNPASDSVSWFQLFSLSFLTYFAWTMIQVPYLALAGETYNSHQNKNNNVTGREGFSILGVLLMLLLPFMLDESITSPNFYKDFLLIFSVVLIISLIWLVKIRLSAKKTDTLSPSSNNPFSQIKLIKRQHPEALLILSPYFFNNLANAIPATLFLIFVEQYLGLKDSVGEFLLAYFLAGMLSLPLWLMLSKKLGRILVWRASILLAIISFSTVFFLENGDYVLYMTICILTGLSLGVDIALPASIQTEMGYKVEQESQNLNGLLFGLWGMLTKLSLAVAVGLNLPALDAATTMGVETEVSLLLLYSVPAILLKIWVWKRLVKVKQGLPLQNL